MSRLARVAAGVWMIAIAAALAVGAFGSASARASVATGGPACPFRWATGVDCPFCGMTRATVALGAGDVRGALDLHPFAPVVLVGLVALLAVVATGHASALLRGRRPVMIVAAMVALWIVRLIV